MGDLIAGHDDEARGDAGTGDGDEITGTFKRQALRKSELKKIKSLSRDVIAAGLGLRLVCCPDGGQGQSRPC